MEIHEHRRTFRTFDGLRGVAALVVVTRHIGPMGLELPHTFLAVDLFFLLSGYVVAHAYDQRLAAGSFFGRFLLVRLIRLYPLYILGIAVGAVAHFGGNTGMPHGALLEATIVGALMLPANPLLRFHASTLDHPVWTLPLELFGNFIYAMFYRVLGNMVLLTLVLISAVSILLCAHEWGQLDLGWEFNDLPIGLSRLGFSFFAGILMFRLAQGKHGGAERPLLAWICLAALVGMLIMPIPAAVQLPYHLALILFCFPTLIFVASKCEPDRRSGRLFRFLGIISYAVYTLHQPLSLGVLRLLAHIPHPDFRSINFITTVLFTAALVPICWAADEFYDAPVRRALGRKLLR